MRLTSRVIDAWEAAQVELRGRYSLARFHEILDHAKQTRPWQHVIVMVLAPLPVLCLIVVMDVLPLSRPDDGVLHQTFGVYLRFFVAVWVVAHMMLMQVRQSSPTLQLSTARHWWISLSTAVVAFAAFIGYGVVIGFPSPFVIHLIATPWIINWVGNIYAAWKDSLARDAEAKHKLVHYMTIVFSAQVAMVFVYSGFLVAFTTIPSGYQTWFTLLLPVTKLAFKNWVIHGAKYMEDLAPTTVVFNVDVFHAIFVSSSMQRASSMGSVIVVMVIDIAQSVVAYYEVDKVLRLVNKLALKSITDQSGSENEDNRIESRRKLKLGVVDFVLDVIESNPRIRSHQDVAFPRHRRVSQLSDATLSTYATPASGGPTNEKIKAPVALIQGGNAARIVPVQPARQVSDSNGLSPQLSDVELAQLECVKGVLKMLHMIEFYVLIEFVEVIVPIINAVSTRLLIYLPNRVYYTSLASLTIDEMTAQADRVAAYACMELLSLVVFCYMMDRRLHHTSAYQILAFVVRKNARVAVTAFSMWVFLIVQLGLRHLGVDYTFRFEWLWRVTSK